MLNFIKPCIFICPSLSVQEAQSSMEELPHYFNPYMKVGHMTMTVLKAK